MNIPGGFAFNKCQCCSNPWNQSEQSFAVSCSTCVSDSRGVGGIDPANFDVTVNPSENFYLWSNGGWKKNNPIPSDYSSWNTFIALRDRNLERLKAILEDLEAGKVELKGEEIKLSNYYKSMMDENVIEELGISQVLPLLSITSKVTSDPTATIAELHSKYGIRVFFSFYSSPDKKDSEHTIGCLSQSGLGLPDRDYYFDSDKADKRLLYIEYIATVLNMAGQHGVAIYNDINTCKQIAKEILIFETEIAASHLTRTQARDPELTYNKMSLVALQKLCTLPLDWPTYLARGVVDRVDGIDWIRYFSLIGKPEPLLGEINVSTVDAIRKNSTLLKSPVLAHYLAFHCLSQLAPHLPAAYVDAHFQFYEKALKGTTEQRPRWKRALESLEDALGEALGKLYVTRYFPDTAKAEALRIVELVRDELRSRLAEVQWMSTETRSEAMKKMEKFKVKIGYPDIWLDYSTLEVIPGAHLLNVFAAKQFQLAQELRRSNAPTERHRWHLSPQTVNAYYHPSLNEIVFPAAILQPPFFDPAADEAVNFGSLGAVVGHEMTHGFDDSGRKYDSSGNIRDWWVGTDGEEYERRASVMINQAEQFEVYGVKLKGKLTCGENVADLGGLKLAYRALKTQLVGKEPFFIAGFTPEQRLFLAWSQAWRENVKRERALQLVTLDPHGPNEWRCNGPLSNMAEFHDAFGIKEGDPMYRSVEQRVDIW